ncbi:MAG: TetR/AcrR family transcriptional regulator [Luteibacter sp.]|uniref:TetR/AcrR family transcriptional regulator n=1 Tax=Luteibacter sp. TaxID=1886636 RepID=UPI002807F8BF|nr:TetR/AcrR family transcriptional regulator [Luteibacter sp.]MDQ7995243.1 TetR/AcrR family transcriptional regulator [Luteibacter sp.]
MPPTLSDSRTAIRRQAILASARWCFLNFGFNRTSLDDIANRAQLSRTLLYRFFKDKPAIYEAVFIEWVLSKQPLAQDAARRDGAPALRLTEVCRALLLEPWAEMICTPMGAEFLAACADIAPASESLYRKTLLDSAAAILADTQSADVFLLALDGLLFDRPPAAVLDARLKILIDRFTGSISPTGPTA